jgi:hypothetical protein
VGTTVGDIYRVGDTVGENVGTAVGAAVGGGIGGIKLSVSTANMTDAKPPPPPEMRSRPLYTAVSSALMLIWVCCELSAAQLGNKGSFQSTLPVDVSIL